jgi:hypothetical protein
MVLSPNLEGYDFSIAAFIVPNKCTSDLSESCPFSSYCLHILPPFSRTALLHISSSVTSSVAKLIIIVVITLLSHHPLHTTYMMYIQVYDKIRTP